jgi:hypothetical protein
MERRIMSITRKDFLRNLKWTAAGATVGAPIGALGLNRLNSTRENWETESFSQSGEDVIVNFILGYLHMAANMTYLDVGAFHPTKLSNTYYFYRGGRRGVLVEPNVDMAELLRTVRPKDVTLVAGIGITDEWHEVKSGCTSDLASKAVYKAPENYCTNSLTSCHSHHGPTRGRLLRYDGSRPQHLFEGGGGAHGAGLQPEDNDP